MFNTKIELCQNGKINIGKTRVPNKDRIGKMLEEKYCKKVDVFQIVKKLFLINKEE